MRIKEVDRHEVESAYLDLIIEGNHGKVRAQLTLQKTAIRLFQQFEFGLANSIDVMDANTLLVTAEAIVRCKIQLSIVQIEIKTLSRNAFKGNKQYEVNRRQSEIEDK